MFSASPSHSRTNFLRSLRSLHSPKPPVCVCASFFPFLSTQLIFACFSAVSYLLCLQGGDFSPSPSACLCVCVCVRPPEKSIYFSPPCDLFSISHCNLLYIAFFFFFSPMKILWESDWQGARIEQTITHLSWIQQQDKPDHGLLGVGTETGSVGVTLTDFKPTPDDLTRYNFNLRGHHNAIRMVTWNKSQSKLASCDASGIIYVWVRNDDRWSVELVNDRGVKVSDLSWSPCGGSALICYDDNFVLIGSANGQRVWSNSFPLPAAVTCGVWAPDSRQLVLGFSTGTIQVLSNAGVNITSRSFTEDKLTQMAFSPLRTKVREVEWTLAMLSSANKIYMISAYDQLHPAIYRSKFQVIRMEWNTDGTILALINANNELVMIDTTCRVIHRERIPIADKEKTLIPNPPPTQKLTAFTWAHNGNVVIIAAGGCLTVGRILFGVPSLFEIVTYDLWKMMGCSSKKVDKLPIPLKEMNALRELDHHVIRVS